ncbi:MAG: Asp-tRNA(Asn)/Glu-tRNA(Gln) amidotransferase subunit GatB [Planctomycetota bacterium]|nr:MAG: Asp-tRNA(Asn)/Glu-tRNA(Gln) amidotransferase subunit GatB [Planctomycetota bacterium]
MATTVDPATARIVRTTLMVGLEIHIELATRTKMFTRVANAAHPANFDAPPNTLIDPVVCALPGALPVMNKAAVEMSMMVGLALECQIARHSKWDRKNYYYPDLPKGYQISQYDMPLCHDGRVEIPGASGTRVIGIIRAHLEEDTGKLSHELPGGQHYAGSLVDLNRAGTPLLEVVTAPDFDCADDVVTFAQELRNICRFLGVTEGIMQKGHMRFEPNINLILELDDGSIVKTPIVEVKNLNSFRALKGAIEWESKRQIEEWRATGRVMGRGMKSTRGWDDVTLKTLLQREKEDAHDYRYFPDPDLVPVEVDAAWLDSVTKRLPELPMARRARYREAYGLSDVDARNLVDDRDPCVFYESCVRETLATASFKDEKSAGYAAGKLVLNALGKRANERSVSVHELGIDATQVAAILALRETGVIGPQSADLMCGLLCETKDAALDVATRSGFVVVRDEGKLLQWVDEAIAANPQAADDVRAGKMAAIGRLVGAVMRLAGGSADAKSVNDALKSRLGQ